MWFGGEKASVGSDADHPLCCQSRLLFISGITMMGFLMTCQNVDGKGGIPTVFGLNKNTEATVTK